MWPKTRYVFALTLFDWSSRPYGNKTITVLFIIQKLVYILESYNAVQTQVYHSCLLRWSVDKARGAPKVDHCAILRRAVELQPMWLLAELLHTKRSGACSKTTLHYTADPSINAIVVLNQKSSRWLIGLISILSSNALFR